MSVSKKSPVPLFQVQLEGRSLNLPAQENIWRVGAAPTLMPSFRPWKHFKLLCVQQQHDTGHQNTRAPLLLCCRLHRLMTSKSQVRIYADLARGGAGPGPGPGHGPGLELPVPVTCDTTLEVNHFTSQLIWSQLWSFVAYNTPTNRKIQYIYF